jgi:hypothetical protein
VLKTKAAPLQKNPFEEKEKETIIIIRMISEPAIPTYPRGLRQGYREAGQGRAGNGHTSRTWKGDGYESQRILGQFSTDFFSPFTA